MPKAGSWDMWMGRYSDHALRNCMTTKLNAFECCEFQRGPIQQSFLLLTFFELFQLIQSKLPWSSADPNCPLESQVIQALYACLGQACLQSLLKLTMFCTLPVHKCTQPRVVTILQRNIDITMFVLVLAKLVKPVFPRAVRFTEGPL
jgi:hypothetical protein